MLTACKLCVLHFRKSGGRDCSHQYGLEVGRLVAAPGVVMAPEMVAVPGMTAVQPGTVAAPEMVAAHGIMEGMSIPCPAWPGGYRQGGHRN